MSAVVSMNTDEMALLIYKDLLFKFHGQDPERDQKIDQAYKKRFGKPFPVELSDDGVNASFLLGSPGQGKTSCVKSALKMFGDDIGAKVHINPDEETFWPEKGDFILITQELSGSVSAIDFGGLPSKVQGEDEKEYMGKLKTRRFGMMAAAGGAIFLLDDMPNATPFIQNVALSISEEGRYQGLDVSNALVVITGNMGAKDGTNVSKVSSAVISRARLFHVHDTLENFNARAQNDFKDGIGDAGLLGFLGKNPELFNPENIPREGNFPCSRTWTKLIKDLRRIMYDSSDSHNENAALVATNHLQKIASSLVGVEAGGRLASYYHALMTGAEPIGSAIMALKMKGGQLEKLPKDIEERMTDVLQGNKKLSADGQLFGWQLAQTIASQTAFQLSSGVDQKLIAERLAFGLVQVGAGPNRQMAVCEMFQRLHNTGNEAVMSLDFKGDVVKAMQNLNCGKSELTSMIDALSQMTKFTSDVKFDIDMPEDTDGLKK